MRPEIYNVSQPHITSDCKMCAPSMILDSDCDYESDYDYDYNELSHISTNYELISHTDLGNTKILFGTRNIWMAPPPHNPDSHDELIKYLWLLFVAKKW